MYAVQAVSVWPAANSGAVSIDMVDLLVNAVEHVKQRFQLLRGKRFQQSALALLGDIKDAVVQLLALRGQA